ncbi:transposase, partial [Aerococcus sp.]|uniref:transposase n=1 Tax=Aerococcus sp. TaxID=1872398 RepID=UPI0025C0D96E
MSHTSIIKQLCGIFDNNIDITILKSMHLLPLEKYHEINHFVLHGVLTYKSKACMHCGVKNTGNQDIIRLPNTATNPVLLKLQKQRFYCKHCAQTFIAETPLVEKFCCISKTIKSQISFELFETQSMRLIAKRYHVSSPTVARTLMKASKGLSPNGNYLPNHLGVDEFKSTSRVANAMSAVLVDTHNRRIIDIVVDRKQSSLIDYFSSFTWTARNSVKTVSIDLYTPDL